MTDLRTKEDVIAFIRDRLEASPRGTATQLANKLGKDRSVITAILAGKRNVLAEELAVIREFFGEPPKLPGRLSGPHPVGGVPLVGRIGVNIWTRAAAALLQPLKIEMVGGISLDYPLADQSAYRLEEATINGEYLPGDLIYVVSFAKYRGELLEDDIVVVKSEQDGFERFLMKQAVLNLPTISLQPLLDEGLTEHLPETVVGLFVGHFRPHRKR
jgi:hypothetical protein